jgi:hypothetical protein
MVRQDFVYFILYFALSTLFTWWFVASSPLYISQEQMILSTGIAGAKWAIQIVLGFFLLKEKPSEFLKNISLVCFIGSCILLPYAVLAEFRIIAHPGFFVGSLIVSVLTMIYFYFRAVKQMHLHIYWWLFWLACLAIAISLQLTIVFHVVTF